MVLGGCWVRKHGVTYHLSTTQRAVLKITSLPAILSQLSVINNTVDADKAILSPRE